MIPRGIAQPGGERVEAARKVQRDGRGRRLEAGGIVRITDCILHKSDKPFIEACLPQAGTTEVVGGCTQKLMETLRVPISLGNVEHRKRANRPGCAGETVTIGLKDLGRPSKRLDGASLLA